ncbi:MAG: phage major capsid protein [Rickettsiaceae bacterium]|nr:MAG: phage major capsid protein [Rickettsiaceae bacterium]
MQGKLNQNFIIKSIQDKNFVISGYASVFGVADQDNDILIKGAFSETINNKVKLLWQHDKSKPIGIINILIEDDYGLKVEAAINSNILYGREAIELIKQGAINALSVGFNIVASSYNEIGQRLISSVELIEISIVTFPANNLAQIAVHNIDNFKEAKVDTELTLKKLNKIENEINTIHSFLARPEINFEDSLSNHGSFNEYVRKGIKSPELVTKALSGNDDEGKVLLTPTLYHKVLGGLTTRSPMRQLASVDTISTNALDIVIEDDKFTCGWVGETDARGDTQTPKLVQKRIIVHEVFAQPKATQRLIDDSTMSIEHWLTERLRDHFLRVENDAFINGDGNKKPLGILANNSHIKEINVGNRVTPDILIDLINSLDESYLANATFLMNRVTLAEIQKLKDNDGKFIWQPSLSDSIKQTIFGIPIVCCAEMPNIGADKCAIAIGDFKAGYKIVDRAGINIMRDPYTDKPFVKFYAVKRVGGDIVNPNAISLAKFSA